MQRGNFEGENGPAHCTVLSLSAVSCTKTAEPIEMPSRVLIGVGPRKHVVDGGQYWRHLANTVEPSMCGGDAAFCRITLTARYYCCLPRAGSGAVSK